VPPALAVVVLINTWRREDTRPHSPGAGARAALNAITAPTTRGAAAAPTTGRAWYKH